jgi:hypothetical protein
MTIASVSRTAIARTAIVLAIVLVTAVAHGQSPEAETLFREAKHLLKQGDIAGACDKFDASERLESTAGTELNVADCREKLGQLATAWAMFVKAAATAKHSDTDGKREAEARRRAAALEPRLIHLRIVVGDDRPEGLVIKRNGTAVDPELWNQRIPVDPGDYVIAAEADGYQSWQSTVTVRGKDKKLEVPALEKAATPAKTPKTDDDTSGDKPHGKATHKADDTAGGDVPTPPPAPIGMSGQRKAAIVFAAVGVAALAAGIGMGVEASSKESQANGLCPMNACISTEGVSLNSDARHDGLYADIGFGAAGALIVTGAALWLLGGSKATVEVSASVGAHGGSFVIGAPW